MELYQVTHKLKEAHPDRAGTVTSLALTHGCCSTAAVARPRLSCGGQESRRPRDRVLVHGPVAEVGTA